MPARRILPSLLGLLAAGMLLAAGGRAAGAEGAAELSEAARWLQGYVRLDTTNPPGDEVRGAAYLARILHREGIPTRLLFTADGRASLYARLEGERDGGGLLLVHHIDVVAPGPGWTVAPFAGEVRSGALWGRGAVDVKSLGVAQLAAFVDLKRSGARLTRDVALLAVADEENGGLQGTAWLLDHHPELFEGIDAVLNEGGANRAIGGRILWWGVERAQKRPLWLRVTASGRGGHGSGLNPHSASHRLIRALADLLALPPSYRVTQAARDYLGALAPYEPPAFRRAYAHLDAYIAPDGPRGPLLPGVANLFLDTVQVTVLDAGQRINVIPDEASALIDVRMLPDTDGEGMLAVIRRALGDRVRCEVVLTSPPAPSSPFDTELFAAVRRVLEPEAQVVPAFISGFTDSRYFRDRGLTTYGLSPFALESDALHGIHGPDERIPLDELDRGVERFRRVVRSFVTRPPAE